MEPVKEVYRPLRKMLRDNFLGGIAWGLGITVGMGVLVAILSLVISRIDFVPIIGQLLKDLMPYLQPPGNPYVVPLNQ